MSKDNDFCRFFSQFYWKLLHYSYIDWHISNPITKIMWCFYIHRIDGCIYISCKWFRHSFFPQIKLPNIIVKYYFSPHEKYFMQRTPRDFIVNPPPLSFHCQYYGKIEFDILHPSVYLVLFILDQRKFFPRLHCLGVYEYFVGFQCFG